MQELLGAVVDPFGSGTPVLLELVDDLTEARGDVPLDGLMGVLGGPLGTCASFGPAFAYRLFGLVESPLRLLTGLRADCASAGLAFQLDERLARRFEFRARGAGGTTDVVDPVAGSGVSGSPLSKERAARASQLRSVHRT